MNNYPHPIIAREGWPFLAGSLALSLAATFWCAMWSIPLWIISLFVLQFFRDPARSAPSQTNAVISAADGKVIVVEKAWDEYLQRDALKISVFMNVFNVHSNRSPIDGRVEKRWYNPGKFFNAALAKASAENERNALWLKTNDGQDITCVQIAGLIARRILCYVEPSASLYRGQRYGFIRFGSRVDIYLPLTAKPKVSLGEKVRAGETILAEI
ncbi:MAG TPA: phosphatidylserine decarboxylase [Methylophilaceae bacterium]|nr:phosphatidylserine decarboxylase [Methylophilaceae bacterium]